MPSTRKSYCRFCHAYCAIEVDVEDGRALTIRGDASDPMYGGYTCIKGRQLPERHHGPGRIREALKRTPAGDFETLPTQQALDEIAERIGEIVENHGPRAVASYCGSYAFQNSAALAVARAWHQGLGSESFYTSVTIDQPAKYIAPARVGFFGSGLHGFEDADVALVIGNNAIISQFSPFGGLPPFNPVKRLGDAQRRGLALVVIDPRRTDMARRADIHLQLRPGEDPTLLSAMLRVIFEEELFDRKFCERHVEGFDALRAAVDDFTPDYAAQRAGVSADALVAAARLFAAGPRGAATTGTGPDMAPRPNLTEHLALCLNVVCGRFNRAGERVPNPGILEPGPTRREQAYPPRPSWQHGPKARVRNLGTILGEMPTAALADEILTPGEGQVHALLSVGGNPVVAWPNQKKVVRALDAIDLHVAVDVEMSASAKLAHYVLPPVLSLERADVTLLSDGWYESPYVHYSDALLPAPPECIEEWELYWELAQRLGIPIELPGGQLSLSERPTKAQVLECALPTPRVPWSEIRRQPGGHIFEEVNVRVEAAKPGADTRMNVAPEGIAEELGEVRAEAFSLGAGYGDARDAYTHRLISRRMRQVYNSSGHQLSKLREKGTTNPAFIHPDDLAQMGIATGDVIEIRSAHAAILGVAMAADDVRPGVVSMAHAWGDPSVDSKEVRDIGGSTNALVDDESDFDPCVGMARQSAIPVNLKRVELP